MSEKKKRVVWFCGLPERIRQEAFADLGLPESAAWSWIAGHLPPPENIDLHIVCGDRRVGADVTRTWNGATFHLVKVLRGGPFLMYEGWAPAFIRKARELKPDVVHGWGTEGAFGLAALRAAPKNHVIGIQGILAVTWPVMKKNLPTWLCVLNERRVLWKAKRCVAESNYSKKTVSQFTSAVVDMVPQPLREEFLSAPLGARNEKIMVYLGVLAHRKGVFDAINAFLSVESDWTLICIGTARSPQEEEELDILLKERNAGDRIVFTGSLPCAEIIRWFQKSPVFLLPSYTDTGPTALKEALAMGLWPVCYDNTGPQELIGRYGVGSLVPTGDITGLTNKLTQVLGEKPWLDTVRMQRASDEIRSDLSPSVVWGKLVKTYGNIIRESCRQSEKPSSDL